MTSTKFQKEIELGNKLKDELSKSLANFVPGELVMINPECYNDLELRSIFFYLDVEDVNQWMGIDDPKWMDSWITNRMMEFHQRIFFVIKTGEAVLERGTYIEHLQYVKVLDVNKVYNIPSYLLTKATKKYSSGKV